MPHPKITLLTLIATTLVLTACAPAVPVEDAHLMSPTAQTAAKIRVVQQSVTIHLSSGYERTIAADSHWRSVGSLPQGEVLKPVAMVFTIEGRQLHEAYLVVAAGNLVGFYLPGEAHFSPLEKPVSITLGELHD